MEEFTNIYERVVPNAFKRMQAVQEIIDKSMQPVITASYIAKYLPKIPALESPIMGNIYTAQLFNNEFYKLIQSFSATQKRIRKNPELQFAFITDLELLNLKSAEELKASLTSNLPNKELREKENLLNENLLPLLQELNLDSLWISANYAIRSNIQKNPDKIRHCLSSLRTILEYLIEDKLAPKSILKDDPKFNKQFKNYHLGKESLEQVRIRRSDKIEYFTSKIEFGYFEDFTIKEINYICDCYSLLCSIHKPDIGLSINQVRVFKVKTGITIWLLAHILHVIEERTKPSLKN